MSKTVNFAFAREHYIGDKRHAANSTDNIDANIAAQLEKAGVGKIVKPADSGASKSYSGKKD